MTMTREEALTIVTSIVREHSRECREPKPCQDCELEAEAIAALSAQEPVARVCHDNENHVGWNPSDNVASLPEGMELYAAPPAQADTKQAEPVSPWLPIESAPRDGAVVDIWSPRRGRLCNYAWEQLSPDNGFFSPKVSGYTCIRDAIAWQPLPAPPAMQFLDAKVEVSDG